MESSAPQWVVPLSTHYGRVNTLPGLLAGEYPQQVGRVSCMSPTRLATTCVALGMQLQVLFFNYNCMSSSRYICNCKYSILNCSCMSVTRHTTASVTAGLHMHVFNWTSIIFRVVFVRFGGGGSCMFVARHYNCKCCPVWNLHIFSMDPQSFLGGVFVGGGDINISSISWKD